MRLSLPQIGIIVGIVSLTFFFAALILAFGLRMSATPDWQPFQVPTLLWAGTGVIALSSVAIELARRALRRALVTVYRTRLLATMLLAVTFIAIQTISALDLIGQGVAAAANPRGSAFYAFMTIHAAHLFGGMIWLAFLWKHSATLFAGTESDLRNQRRNLSAAALFWHFLGILWLVLFFFLRRWAER